jgi:methanogenic corrinoid protein MtbC1
VAARDVIKFGVNPASAVENGLARGLRTVRDKFGDGEVFLNLIMAAVMSAGLEILKPERRLRMALNRRPRLS